MKSYSLTHLSDQTLVQELAAHDDRHRNALAALLAYLAEFDERRLYLPAAFPSMFLYCTQQLHWCEQAAFKRIRAARTARRFPAIFAAVAGGRLHLSAVVLLAPHLTAENADELLAIATHKTKAQIEHLLAERFPRPDVNTQMRAYSPASTHTPQQLSPGTVEGADAGGSPVVFDLQLSPGTVAGPASVRTRTFDQRPKVVPLAPQRFALQFMIEQATHDKLRYTQALLGHQIPAGDIAAVFDRALRALILHLEKQKFAATSRPHRTRPTTGARHVPAQVKRAVWARDSGQCTFVSETGRRCAARTRLEYDHLDEVARGGRASVGRMRLRCRAHNQYEAERTFGVEFMRHKREQARCAAAVRAERATQRRTAGANRPAKQSQAAVATRPTPQAHVEEVIPWLRQLGFRADEARGAAALCASSPEASLEQRVRLALSYFRPRTAS